MRAGTSLLGIVDRKRKLDDFRGRSGHFNDQLSQGTYCEFRRISQIDRAGHILRLSEDENAKLKKLLAEAMLDNAMPKDIAAKKW